jgi:MYXO-CTERM domain-containing protein
MRALALAKTVSVSFVLAATWLGSPLPATACSCQLDPVTGMPLYPDADVIFKGTVLGDAEPTSIDLGNGSSWPMYRFRVRVDRYFKGLLGQDIEILTDDWRAHCGFQFERRSSYLVYGQVGQGGELQVSSCSDTVPISEAAEALSSLGKGTAPDRSQDVVREGAPEENVGCSVSVAKASAGTLTSVLGTGLLLGMASLRRRQRHPSQPALKARARTSLIQHHRHVDEEGGA